MDDEVLGWLILGAIVIWLVIMAVAYSAAAVFDSWWVQLLGVLVTFGALQVNDELTDKGATTQPLANVVGLELSGDEIVPKLKRTFTKEYNLHRRLYAYLVIALVLAVGETILFSKSNGGQHFKLYVLGGVLYVPAVIATYRLYNHFQAAKYLRSFKTTMQKRVDGITATIDVKAVSQEITKLTDTARAAKVRLQYNYRTKLRELLTEHTNELLDDPTSVEPLVARLRTAVQDDFREFQEADRAIKDLDRYYWEVVADIRAAGNGGLMKLLNKTYSSQRLHRRVDPLLAAMAWDELGAIIKDVIQLLSNVHDNIQA